jgi:exosortase D (VPLPA-CTERM-specific)
MNFMGQLSSAVALSWIGVVVALVGNVLAIGGYRLLRASFFPIVFLLFATPLPNFLNSALTLQLQLVSSALGASFIRIAGIPVYLDGNIIDLGTYKLLIVEACSGLRYVFPLLSLSFLAAYVFHAPFWQRALLFLSSTPIAIGMNGLRIGILGVLVEYWGPEAADGALHLFEGWIIFVACAALLIAEMYLLALSSGKTLFQVFELPTPEAVAPSQTKRPGSIRPLAACCVLLAIAAVVAPNAQPPGAVEPRTRFVNFPNKIGLWHGRSVPLDAPTESILRADDYLLADYTSADGEGINFFVAYYGNLVGKKALHSPSDCIPAGGWAIVDRRGINRVHPLERVVVAKAGKKLLVYYWFDEQGKAVANEYLANFYRLTNSIVKRRSDAALIRLVTEISPNETEDSADNRLESFLQIAEPALANYLP